MTTLRDIAKEAKVSIMTVSNVINGHKHKMNKETYEKVLAIIEKKNYIPSASARSLTLQRSKIIALWLPSEEGESLLNYPYYSYIAGAIEKKVDKYSYSLMLLSMKSVEEFVRKMKEWNIDAGIGSGVHSKQANYIEKNFDRPFVFIDSYFDEQKTYTVRTDDYKGAFLATDYLLEKGHKKVGMITGPEIKEYEKLKKNGVLYERYKGYKDALEKHDSELYSFGGSIDYQGGITIGKKISKQNEITGFFCTADIMAVGVIEGIKLMGKTVPEDYSIVGYDDLPISQYTDPKLTTIRQDNSLKGEKAVEILLNSLENKRVEQYHFVFDVEIIERETVRKV